MWFPFWRSRDRFSVNEFKYLTDQLSSVQTLNDANKDFVIEALRSIAELVIYGDQHDPTIFEFFMEKQIMGEFVRILKAGRSVSVSLQLLQTLSIIIQNVKNEHAIYYIFSNEHINCFVTYSYDLQNEELLSYYISFLRAISVKLNKNTISLLVKTQHDEVVSFPLYVEAVRFAFHEENMVRTAVRALTLNIYHGGDESVNRFVTRSPQAEYFSNLVMFFRMQCIKLNDFVLSLLMKEAKGSNMFSVVDEIEDELYYFNDVISAGIPDIGKLIVDNMLRNLIFPMLLPSFSKKTTNEKSLGAITSFYLLCCILRLVKIKDLANSIATSLFYPPEAFPTFPQAKPNGCLSFLDSPEEIQLLESGASSAVMTPGRLAVSFPMAVELHQADAVVEQSPTKSSSVSRDSLLSYIIIGDDIQVAGSLTILSTLLHTKELDESMLDALGILPQRKQHTKRLLQALVGDNSGEDRLFSVLNDSQRDGVNDELDAYRHKLKNHYGVISSFEVGASPRAYRFQVLDTLVNLLCRSDISAEILWDGGWLLRQLLPYSAVEFNERYVELLKDAYNRSVNSLMEEARDIWQDVLILVLHCEWRRCKKVLEASSLQKEPRCILSLMQQSAKEASLEGTSFTSGERMWETAKVFVLLLQHQIFVLGRISPDQPPIDAKLVTDANSRAAAVGLDTAGPRTGVEIKLVEGVPCRVAFERGKERYFHFLAAHTGFSGLVLLAEQLPERPEYGVICISAPLSGSRPEIDSKHPTWLHLRIRPWTLPFINSPESVPDGRSWKGKGLVDGRWTLAFMDAARCQQALSMIVEESNLQGDEVERRIKDVLDVETVCRSIY